MPSASSPSRPVLVLATLNPAKGRELVELLGLVPFEIRLLAEIPGARLPEETGSTYAENALVKARTATEQTGELALGDDSGLEVDALGGRPDSTRRASAARTSTIGDASSSCSSGSAACRLRGGPRASAA